MPLFRLTPSSFDAPLPGPAARPLAGTRGLRLGLIAGCVAALCACSTVENMVAGDKIDYKGSANARNTGLEVPPDLTQLAKDPRMQQAGGVVSASTFQTAAAPVAPTVAGVVPKAGDLRIERQGSQRWIVSALPPEQLWPQLQAFWRERGLALTLDQPDAGVMETEWAENRAKLPNDIIRNTLGRLVEPLYSTGEKDKFRTRVERTASGGSEIYLSHRGMIEVYTSQQKESTAWQARPNDPQLEAEFLQRILVKLGVKDEVAKTQVAATPSAPARARLLTDQAAASLQVDDSFDRAWRRVGLALDRTGFTVEDRDRTQGVYFVRYVDPAQAGKEEPGFFSRLLGGAKVEGPARYRVTVKAEGERSTVRVLNAQGGPENGDAGKRIVSLLVDDLK